MSDVRITLEFDVPEPDPEGAVLEALFSAALDLAPPQAAGFVGSGNDLERKAGIVFDLVDVTQEFAARVEREMHERIASTVLATAQGVAG